MGLSCCCKMLKYVVFIVNFLATLAGIALLVITAWALINLNSELKTASSESEVGAIKIARSILVVLLVLGCLMMVFGFLGCCGAARESQCLLGLFSGLMMIGIIVVIIGGVVLHQNKDEILLDINKNIEKIYEKPITNKDAIKFLQETMKCCGAKSFNDFNITDVDFPKSCCRDQSKECEAPKEFLSIITPDEQYYPSCIKEATRFFNAVITASPILLGIIGIIQVLAFAFTLALCCAIRNNTYHKAGFNP